jgi:hypothetical protein
VTRQRFCASVLGLGVGLLVAGASPVRAQQRDAATLTIHQGHPRLFFTAEGLPALRDRIAKYYHPEFQNFIDLLNDTHRLSRGQAKIETNWAGLNYAFVAALDPEEMARRGFHFPAAFQTSRAYCDKAMASDRALLPDVTAGQGQEGEVLGRGYPDPKYLSVVTTYDWCYANLADADRRAIVDAYVSAYKKKYEGKDALTMDISGLPLLANQRVSADVDDTVGIVGFYGDAYPDAALQSRMLKTFADIWLQRLMGELNYFYRPATGWHEGNGGYLNEAFLNFSVPIAMFSSALGHDYIAATPFFSEYSVFVAANTRPHSQLLHAYYDRWGTLQNGIGDPSCKDLILNAGMLRSTHPDKAALAKWMHEKVVQYCGDTVTRYGGSWSNAVLYWFLFGDRDVQPRSPTDVRLPNAVELGLGEYVMRSGYGSSDSQAIFYAQGPRMYGHDSAQYASFSLHKFGNLIIQGWNAKSGAGKLKRGPDKGSLFVNVVSLHKGQSDPGLTYTGGHEADPFFAARGIRGIGKAGAVIASTLNGPGFDYVGYDDTPMWSAETASLSQREFIDLHGPADREFLVVFDRFDAKNPSTDEKVWRIRVPTKPDFVNGQASMPRQGQWISKDSDTIEMTNAFSGLTGKDFESAPTHGRFFMKTLWPTEPLISFVGGDGLEFESGDDDGTTPWGAPPMTQAEREYLGWGRVEVRPPVRQAYDVFLNVVQFGDAKTLMSMAPTSRLESADKSMVGTHIGDPSNQWVVMLARRESDEFQPRGVTYTFEPVASASRHLVVDMARSTTFYVTVSAAGADTTIDIGIQAAPGSTPVSSNDQGVLSFEVAGTQVIR